MNTAISSVILFLYQIFPMLQQILFSLATNSKWAVEISPANNTCTAYAFACIIDCERPMHMSGGISTRKMLV